MPASARDIVVIKLGGSAIFSQDLDPWVEAIAGATAQVILVTGGGKYADAVRDNQKRLHFNDKAAHDMALLAMDQTALSVANSHDIMRPATTIDEMEECLSANLIPVWRPFQIVTNTADIEASWRVTSDSLALWLAQQLSARALLLIKSKPLEARSHNLMALVRDGVLDEAFPDYMQKAHIRASILCPGDWDILDREIRDKPSRPIVLALDASSTTVRTKDSHETSPDA